MEKHENRLLGLLPGAVPAIQHFERGSFRGNESLVESKLEKPRSRRLKILTKLRSNRAARQQDHILVTQRLCREVVVEETYIIDVRQTAGRIAMVDESQVGMRKHRIHVPAGRPPLVTSVI